MTVSFPHRMVAVAARMVLAAVEDLPAFAADVAAVVVVVVAARILHWLIKRTAAWVERHVKSSALDREYAELCAKHSPSVPRPRPATPPPVRRVLKRSRMPSVRIPRRYVRHATSSSDRRIR